MGVGGDEVGAGPGSDGDDAPLVGEGLVGVEGDDPAARRDPCRRPPAVALSSLSISSSANPSTTTAPDAATRS
ncbi:hypothetical protein [Actinomycetospora sp. CA-053990]|uniref:hypothetical protein n=1 Tax=Actinomycetospora sp. CA-053990 TaxID=3239891 RepID=UPI003D943121